MMCDDGGGGWAAQGCGKEKAAARSPFLGFPVMGVMRVSKVKSVACELTGPSVSLYSIRLHTTVPADKATSYTSTFQTGISITLLTPNVL